MLLHADSKRVYLNMFDRWAANTDPYIILSTYVWEEHANVENL